MELEPLTNRELDALIADRNGNRVFARQDEGEDFYLIRDGEELGVAEYSSKLTYLRGERAAGVVPEDPTGLELYQAALTENIGAREQAEAFVRAFVASPDARLEVIRRRKVD